VRGPLTALSLLAGIIILPAGGALAAPSLPPDRGIGIRLVGASDSAVGLSRSYIVDRLAPGTSLRRQVEISNTTRSTVDVAIYPAAATVRGGRFAFAPGRRDNELSSWTVVSRNVARMPPGTKALETLMIHVPENASPGERYAVAWAEVSAPAADAGGVTLVNRVGVRMYVAIGPGAAPAAAFRIGSLTAERGSAGEPLVLATVHNSGRRTLEIGGTLTLSSSRRALRAGPFRVELGAPLVPGDSQLASVRLDKGLPNGPWRARMQLRSGRVQRAAAATITFPPLAGAATEPATPTRSFDSLILAGIAILVLLAIAFLAFLRWQRRRRRGDPEPALEMIHTSPQT
jgi:hypothetical protein